MMNDDSKTAASVALVALREELREAHLRINKAQVMILRESEQTRQANERALAAAADLDEAIDLLRRCVEFLPPHLSEQVYTLRERYSGGAS
jgi:hypothetical protein